MNRLIEWCNKPKVLLLIFPKYSDLHNWLQSHKKDILDKGATIKLTTHEITFLNNSKLYLGYAEKEEDFDKYLSLEYDVIIGGNDQLRRRAIVNKL